MRESIYLIQMRMRAAKGRPNGGKWSVDFGGKNYFSSIRKARWEAKRLEQDFPRAEFRAKLFLPENQ